MSTEETDSSRPAVFRAFELHEFLTWKPWRELAAILKTNGGAYGLSGPRGSGKTWLMRRAVTEADDLGGIGLWFPAPSTYDAESFLATLADGFATQVQSRFDWDGPKWYDRAGQTSALFVGLFLILVGAGLYYVVGSYSRDRYFMEQAIYEARREARYFQEETIARLEKEYARIEAENPLDANSAFRAYEAAVAKLRAAQKGDSDAEAITLLEDQVAHTKFRWESALEAAKNRPAAKLQTGEPSEISIPSIADTSGILLGLASLAAASLCGIGILSVVVYPVARVWTRRSTNRLCDEADRLRKRIRYSTSMTDSSELSAGNAKAWGIFKRSASQEFVERPFTITSLVQEFRSLLSRASRTTGAPIVVAVDELDKLHDSEIARRLLRDIKGIFEVAGVHFLVSISDEATASLSLGQVQSRDEFHSSFYSVIDAGHRTPSECADLLTARAPQFPRKVAEALGVLAGGVPRELLRLADVSRDAESTNVPDVLSYLLQRETQVLLSQLLLCKLSGDAKTALYDVSVGLTLEEFSPDGSNLAQQFTSLSDPAWFDDAQLEPNVRESWERLILRFAISSVLVDKLESTSYVAILDELQSVVVMAERSANIAQRLLLQAVGNESTVGEEAMGGAK